MRDRDMAAETALAVNRHRMRVRTVAVTFAAAVHSAHRDLDVGPAERDALIESWRAWTLEALDEYAGDVDRVAETDGRCDEELASSLRDELEAARAEVRGA